MERTDNVFEVVTTVKIPDERVQNLLVSAFEGGSNYWYFIESYEYGGGYGFKDFEVGGRAYDEEWAKFPCYQLPFIPGCSLIISYPITEDDEERGRKPLDRAALQRGLEIMQVKYPSHWNELIRENEDAGTADVFLQCAMFGEVIFG